jgi:multicomponent Na+:H+ antiporter subunit E
MPIFSSNVLLAVIWMFLHSSVTMNQFLLGFVLGYVILYFFRGLLPDSSYFRRTLGLLKFLGLFAWKNVQANFIVAWEVITPSNHMRPGFLKINPEAETPLEITWLANTISLIPGTLTVDTSEDDDYLYIHAMHIRDSEEIKREITEDIEPAILEFLR